MRLTALLLIAFLDALAPAEAKKALVALKKLPATTQGAVEAKEVSLVRVNVTGQPFDYFRPCGAGALRLREKAPACDCQPPEPP